MPILKSYLLLASFALLCSCQMLPTAKKPNQKQGTLGKLIEQIETNSQGTALQKSLKENGKVETVTNQKPNYAKELGLFKKADLSPALVKKSYSLSTTQTETGRIETLTATTEKVEVRSLQISYGPADAIEQIAMRLSASNYLYDDSLAGSLIVDNTNGTPRLGSYEIRGKQKVILGRAFSYQIIGKSL